MAMKTIRLLALFLVPVVLFGTLLFLTIDSSSYKVFVIHTGSMSPTIPSGSAVLVHEGHYRLGQVITLTEDGLTVTHRLVSINAAGLTTTKGDANATVDPWHVPKAQIIGGVVLAPRFVGYWILYFKNPLGIVSALVAVLVVWQILTLLREETTQSRKRQSQSDEMKDNLEDDESGNDKSLISAESSTES